MIHIEGLQKRFGHTWVLRDVNLEIASGQCVCLFGPNGAGKSTLLRILATLSAPSGGRVTIGGCDLQRDATQVRRLIGYVAHQPMLYADLSAEENLIFFARLYDVAPRHERITHVLQLVGLAARRADRVRTFSRGMAQRLTIARALLSDPPILLLDEPDDGLDPQAADQLQNYLAGTRTIVMVSHHLARGLAMADRIALLANGRIVYDATTRNLTLGELEQQYRQHVGNVGAAGERLVAA